MINLLQMVGICMILWFGMGIGLVNGATLNYSETREKSCHTIPVRIIAGVDEPAETNDSGHAANTENNQNHSDNQIHAMVFVALAMLGLSARSRRNPF